MILKLLDIDLRIMSRTYFRLNISRSLKKLIYLKQTLKNRWIAVKNPDFIFEYLPTGKKFIIAQNIGHN